MQYDNTTAATKIQISSVESEKRAMPSSYQISEANPGLVQFQSLKRIYFDGLHKVTNEAVEELRKAMPHTEIRLSTQF
jgi:hypothetical protein